jgi:hypothetical protein
MPLTYCDLSELATSDQLKIRAFLRYRHHAASNYTTEHEWVGKKVWRPVDVIAWKDKMVREPWDDLLIQDSLTKSKTMPKPVKILRAKQRFSDKEWIARDADELGIVCLCFDPIPEDWTWFEIIKVHFLETSLIVKPVIGDKQELFRMF